MKLFSVASFPRLPKSVGAVGAPLACGTRGLEGIVLSFQSVSSRRCHGTVCNAVNPVALGLTVMLGLGLVGPGKVEAYEYVRVQDVESDMLQAGLNAANERNWSAAERFFQTYLKQEDPNSASGYSNLGNVHLQQGKVELAIKDYDRALELAPEAAVPLLNRGLAYEQLGVQKEALLKGNDAYDCWVLGKKDLEKAIEIDPDEFVAYYDLGLIELRLGEFEQSSLHLQKAADLAPGIAGYRVRAAVLLFQTGDVDRAAQQLRGVVRKYGNYAEAHAALGGIYWYQGKVGAAEEELAKAVDLDGFWNDPQEVRRNTRWPPKLYHVYDKLIHISA